MPRTKKPAGTTVDRRNGRRADLATPGTGSALELPDDLDLCPEARTQWDAYLASPAASVQTAADRGIALRWIKAVDRAERLFAAADLEPLVGGSTGQLVANPMYALADRERSAAERAEKQLGIGALNRSGLGIAVITERRSLAELNDRYKEEAGAAPSTRKRAAGGRPPATASDPRVIVGQVVT